MWQGRELLVRSRSEIALGKQLAQEVERQAKLVNDR